jgi:hypothetical protein
MLSTVRIAEFDPHSYDFVDYAPHAIEFGSGHGNATSSNESCYDQCFGRNGWVLSCLAGLMIGGCLCGGGS